MKPPWEKVDFTWRRGVIINKKIVWVRCKTKFVRVEYMWQLILFFKYKITNFLELLFFTWKSLNDFISCFQKDITLYYLIYNIFFLSLVDSKFEINICWFLLSFSKTYKESRYCLGLILWYLQKASVKWLRLAYPTL